MHRITLVKVYVDLVVFTHIAGTLKTDGDLCKHLGIDSSTDDRYSNLFLNAYISRHVHAENLKMI